MVLMSNHKRVCLRLDDGSLVGPAEVLGVKDAAPGAAAVLDVDAAFAAGKLPQASVGKLESLLRQLAARLPPENKGHAAPVLIPRQLKSVEMTPGLAQVDYHRQQAAVATPRANGHASAGYNEPTSPFSPAGGDVDWIRGEFEQKCLDILAAVWPVFGAEVVYFDHPVEGDKIRDYYQIIPRKDARDLGTIKTHLQLKEYASPANFLADMQLFFRNCEIYNGVTTHFGQMGKRAEKVFYDRWNASGLESGPRARRATAGIAAAKFEPRYSPPPPEKRAPLRTSSARSGGSRPQRAPKRMPSQTSGGGAKAAKSRGEMPRPRMQQIATALGEMEGDDLGGVLEIIREGQDNLPDNGEIELDFDNLDHATLWKLDDYLKKINKGTGAGGTFQVLDDSDSDGEESESDSADD